MDHHTPYNDVHIILQSFKGIPVQYLEKAIISEALQDGMVIKYNDAANDRNQLHRDWFISEAFVSVELTRKFCTDFILTSSHLAYKVNDYLQNAFGLYDGIFKKMYTTGGEWTTEIRLNKLSVYYLTIDRLLLHFIYHAQGDMRYQEEGWLRMIAFIQNYELGDPSVRKMCAIPMRADNMIFLHFDEASHQWLVQNILLQKTKKLSEKYRKDKNDGRIAKPTIMMNQENYHRHFIWDNQWSLHMNEAELILPKPNDIALYQSLMTKSLHLAKECYEKQVKIVSEPVYEIIAYKNMKSFYDYFEHIISAIIFSYTSIEALANTCIVDGYEHVEEKNDTKTIFYKPAIERKFSLREKLKLMVRNILNTPDPSRETWWNDFIRLENIRNEIIHTKQSKSQDRYTTLLSRDIFQAIEVSRSIITFCGFYIDANTPSILDDFPYDFGYDNVLPSLMTNESYIKSWRTLKGFPDKDNNDPAL